nr:hypothetical protein [Tanacetum cinerariifolium]
DVEDVERLRVDTLTPKLLVRPTFELMKGSCTSLIVLEYHLEEVYKATTDQLDWVNLEGQQRDDDDDDDKDEGPSAGSDWGYKRRREGKEPESASAPLKTATRSACRSTTGSKSRQASVSESAFAEEPVQTTTQMDEPSYLVFET